MAEESDADDGTGDGQPVDGDSRDSDADARVESDGGGTDADDPGDAGDPSDDAPADTGDPAADPADTGGDPGDGDADDDGERADVPEDDRPAGTDDGESAATDENAPTATDENAPADSGTAAGGDGPIGAVTDADDTPATSAPEVALGDRPDAEATGDDAASGEGTDPDEGSASGLDDDAEDEDSDAASDDATDADGATDTDDGDGTATHYDASAAREAGEWESELAEDADEYETALADDPTAPPAEAADAANAAGAAGADHAAGPAADTIGGEGAMPEGPPDDQEMPLADHVEEMVLRLAVVCGVATVVAGTVFFFEPLAETMILFIWESVIPSPDVADVPRQVGGTAWPGHYVSTNVAPSNPRVYGPLELKLTELKFASLVGFVVALPVFVYETYRFMRPGLYPHERRYYLAAVPTSLVLAFVGVSFAYFIILPAIFAYFVRYSERAGLLAFALRQTFDLILVLMGYMALVFQIPLFIMLAIMMGLTDRQWLQDRRLYFWGGFLGVSFLFVPEPTGMAPILVALTMIGLFEGTLALLRWTGN